MGREVGGGSGWGTHGHPWQIHVNVWQKPPQYCKVISLQLKKKNKKKQGWNTELKGGSSSGVQCDFSKNLFVHSLLISYFLSTYDMKDSNFTLEIYYT